MQKSGNKPSTPADLREVAAVCKKRLAQELPILQDMAYALEGITDLSFFRTPMVVHNLAVIDNTHIYQLIPHVLAIYRSILGNDAWQGFVQSEKERAYVRDYGNQLLSLYDQEAAAQAWERKQANFDIESMQHVEFDLSLFLGPVVSLLSAGYPPNHGTRKAMRTLTAACAAMTRRCLSAKKKAYETTRQIVGK